MNFITNYIASILPTFQHLGTFGYWLVLLIALVESLAFVGSVVPGAILVTLAGFLSAQGYLDLGDLIWFASIGAIMGDGLSYWLGTKGTRLFREENRWLKRAHLEKGEQFFKKHGGKSVFLGRFVGPLRSIIPFIAGLSKMNRWQFFLWNAASAFLWATAHLLLGYFFSGALNVAEAWSTRAGIFIVAVIIAVILIRIIVKYSHPFFTFLKSISISIKNAIIANPDIQKFVHGHPRFFTFAKRRFDTNKFSGLTLTLLFIAFTYVLSAFAGTIQDIVTSEPLVAADIRVANLLYVFRDAEFIKFFLWVTLLAKWQMIVSFSVVTLILLWIWKKRVYLLPFLTTVLGSYLFYTISKIIIHRPRPDITYYLESSYSFPSGHATMAVAFYGFLVYILFRQLKHWKTKANILFASLLVILGVGLSRIYIGVHYLSDVWGGYLLGALWLIIGISIAEWLKRRKPEEAILISRSVKTASVILPILGLIFYIGFALQYNPPLNTKITTPTTVVTSNIQNLFQEDTVPKYTETLIGDNQEPISLVVIAKDDQEMVNDMKNAGWTLASMPDVGSMLNLARAALLNQNYPTAPMTPSFWNAKVHDFGFEKPTETQSVRERHHARFWKTNIETPDGEHVYVGTASLDTGIKWLITHKIAPDIDSERELLLSDLEKRGLVASSQKIQSVSPVLGQNFTGDQFFTDGKLDVIYLK